MCPKCQDHMAIDLKKFLTVKIIDLEKLFCPAHPRIRQPYFFLFCLIVGALFQRRHKEIRQLIVVPLHTRYTRDHK